MAVHKWLSLLLCPAVKNLGLLSLRYSPLSNVKDLIRPAVQQPGQHTKLPRGRADKSRLN